MTIIWADGFDHYGTTPNGGCDAMLRNAWAQFSAGNGNLPDIVSTQARTGTYSLRFQKANGATEGPQARRVLGASKTVVGVALGIYPESLPEANGFWGFEFRNNTNTNILKVTIESDGSLAFRKGVANTLVGISDPVVGAGAFSHIEVKAVIDSVVGSIEARVNGLPVFVITNQDLGVSGCTQLSFGCFGTPLARTMYYDDIVIWDDTGATNNDFLGVQRVETVFPVSDTVEADFIKNGAATGFGCINQTAPDYDVTYLSSAVVTDRSEFGVGALPPETETIAAVYVPVMARINDAGIGNVKVSMKSASSVVSGPDYPLTTAYAYWGSVFPVDPDTGVAWTKAGLEAALLRIEKTA